ncbi:hypothetical protein LCGC14_0495220 [marine sediment metagenome]|uniref:Uncharacterized protein n=1 Tax=marine sediment metagenome TaxID=412755 RepID=A0A0F9S5E8_9ZZZZ
MNLIKEHKNKEKMGKYYFTAEAEKAKVLALCEQDLDKLQTQTAKTDLHFIIPNYHDCIKVGISLLGEKDLEFWAEVKSDIPYFGDKSETITIDNFIEDLSSNTFTNLPEVLTYLKA